MKKVPTGIAAIALLIGTPALAANMAVKAPPSAPAPVYNWTGFYVGVNAGGSFDGRTGAQLTGFSDPTGGIGLGGAIAGGAIPITSYSSSGFLGGGQAGYNWQFDPHWLVGLETDFMGSDIRGSETTIAGPPVFVTNITTVTQRLDWLGTSRVKAGYVVGNWLVYGTGGVAYGRTSNSLAWSIPANAFSGQDSSIQTGWAAGTGVEYGWGNWLLRVEYLHYNLNKHTITTTSFAGLPGSLSVTQAAIGNILRGGVSWKFN
jgi:outer membrane immunogenic protein